MGEINDQTENLNLQIFISCIVLHTKFFYG